MRYFCESYMILYPTETIYALGANVFDPLEMGRLYALKGRNKEKQVSWLVRNVDDISRYAILEGRAEEIASRFLPGELTLVLPLREEIIALHPDIPHMIGFRVSTDPEAQKVIADFMHEHDVPLTCTSANVSGMPTLPTPEKICAQFGERASMIDTIIDKGERSGVPTTVVRITGDTIEILREGAIARDDLLA